MVIFNNQDTHDDVDDDGEDDDDDYHDDDDADHDHVHDDHDDTIIFLSPCPPVATHPPLLARH